MNRKPTTDQKIDGLTVKFDGLANTVDTLATKVDVLTDNVGELRATVRDVLDAVSGLSTHMDSEFANVRSQMVTKDDLKSELDRRFSESENRITNEIDRFVVLHQTLDVELVSLRSRTNRHDAFLQKVAHKLDMAYEPT